MDTYFERLQEIIQRHEQEINHLNIERTALRKEERNMPIEEFNREYQKIINYLENETRSLNEAQTTLESYHYNYDKSESLIKDLRSLRDELSSARDEKDEDEINEEITRKEAELRSAISALPLELADYLRNSILNISREEIFNNNSNISDEVNASESLDNTNDDVIVEESLDNNVDNLQEEVTPDVTVNTLSEEDISNDYANTLSEDAQKDYNLVQEDIEKLKQTEQENEKEFQESIRRINEIMQEERTKYETEGPFANETLTDLQNYYMRLKNEANATFLETKKNKTNLTRRLKSLEKKQAQIIEINNFALDNDITYDQSKKLFSSLKNRKTISKILEQKGLGNIIHKSSRTKEERKILQEALNDIKKEVVDFKKDNANMSIKDTINVLYGMDSEVSKVKDAKKTEISENNRLAIINNAKQLPAVIRKENINQKENLKKASAIPLISKSEDPLALPAAIINNDKDLESKNDDATNKKEENIKIEPPKRNEEIKVKRGLREIIGTLRKDLDIGKKDGGRYRRSNLKVSQNFVRELQSGNTLYNIVHVVPATIKASAQLLSKISGKIMLGRQAKEMMQTLENRIDNLKAEDLETIFKEYRGNRINQERYPQALNMVIEEKMSEYILGKVTVLNNNITQRYNNIFKNAEVLKYFDKNIRKGKLSEKEKISKLETRKRVLNETAQDIKYIRDAKIEADNLLSGGLHGLSEDMKAAATKLNCVGMRFTKEHDMDNDLEDALMDCEKRENKAIAEGDDESLLKAFIESEMLLSKNTQISYSIFGKRSTGKKYYSPLAEQLNYSNDPFIRDLFSTIAVATSAVSAINASNNMKVQQNETEQLLVSEKELLDKVHKAGEEITSKKGAMYEGMRAQTNQDVLTSSGTIERATLDVNGWTLGTDAYHTADRAGHAFTNNFYNNVQERFANVSSAYTSKAIDEAGVLQELAKISNDSHATLVNVTDKCLEILRPYAQNNPQFDLAAAQDAMQYIVDHPDAIANMNQAMVDVQNVGEQLLNISQTNIEAISNLPGNLGPTIMSAASACALASRVSSTMNTTSKAKYGNAVTDMVDEYSERFTYEGNEKTH